MHSRTAIKAEHWKHMTGNLIALKNIQ